MTKEFRTDALLRSHTIQFTASVWGSSVQPPPSLTAVGPHAQFRERLEELVRRGAFHPKLAALVEALRRHFGGDADCGAGDAAEAIADGGGGGGDQNDMGRAIVFTNLRESVATIVDTLGLHAPLIKPRCVTSVRRGCLWCAPDLCRILRIQQTSLPPGAGHIWPNPPACAAAALAAAARVPSQVAAAAL